MKKQLRYNYDVLGIRHFVYYFEQLKHERQICIIFMAGKQQT